MSFDLDAVRSELASLADDDTAHRHGKQVRCLRGIRGVPFGDVARLADRLWRASHPILPRDAADLEALFTTAWEDGLVAVGLLATTSARTPEDSQRLALRLAGRVDDHVTADALGWLVFGPLAAHLHLPYPTVVESLVHHARPEVRRVAVSGALAFTPAVVEGPAASPLRAQVGQSKIRISDGIDARVLGWAITTFRRDEPVARAVRRLITTWGAEDAEGLVGFVDALPGGLPPVLAAEVRPFRGAR
jgi:hypothetical protein